MRSLERFKAGDILLVTSLYVRGYGWRRGRMWAVVENARHHSMIVAIFYGSRDALSENEIDTADKFKRVSLKRTPGYVCAALAKWRLTEEKTIA